MNGVSLRGTAPGSSEPLAPGGRGGSLNVPGGGGAPGAAGAKGGRLNRPFSGGGDTTLPAGPTTASDVTTRPPSLSVSDRCLSMSARLEPLLLAGKGLFAEDGSLGAPGGGGGAGGAGGGGGPEGRAALLIGNLPAGRGGGGGGGGGGGPLLASVPCNPNMLGREAVSDDGDALSPVSFVGVLRCDLGGRSGVPVTDPEACLECNDVATVRVVSMESLLNKLLETRVKLDSLAESTSPPSADFLARIAASRLFGTAIGAPNLPRGAGELSCNLARFC